MEPPRQYRAHRPVVAPPLRAPASPASDQPEEHETTLVGMPPRPGAAEGARDGREIQIETLLRELADAERVARAEAEKLRVDLAAALRAAPSASSLPPSRGDWLKGGYKLMGAVTLFLGILGTYLGGRSLTKESTVENVAAASSAQKTATSTVEERVKALEKYTVALAKHSDCVDAERDSAIERGTGHVIEGEHAQVEWAEQSAPVAKPRTIWKNAPWLIAKDEACPSKPAPPRPVP